MTRDHILSEIRAAAVRNGGRPLGARVFHSQTGITRTDLWNAGFPRYGEAVAAAGLVPNKLQGALDATAMFAALAALVRRLGNFPSISDLKVARAEDPTFPSYEAYFRLAGGAYRQLPHLLREYCLATAGQEDVAALLAASRPMTSGTQDASAPRSGRVIGYVYLAKHGRDYKLGRSNDVVRRRREIALLLPAELKHVHLIETDDPEGIELYWQRRFEERRVRGEWYRLTPADVIAFKRRRYQ
jgi:hypothetical protein